MKRSTLYALAAVCAVAALFFVMTTARAKVQCRVCVAFRGRTNCATAVGASEPAARAAAQEAAPPYAPAVRAAAALRLAAARAGAAALPAPPEALRSLRRGKKGEGVTFMIIGGGAVVVGAVAGGGGGTVLILGGVALAGYGFYLYTE